MAPTIADTMAVAALLLSSAISATSSGAHDFPRVKFVWLCCRAKCSPGPVVVSIQHCCFFHTNLVAFVGGQLPAPLGMRQFAPKPCKSLTQIKRNVIGVERGREGRGAHVRRAGFGALRLPCSLASLLLLQRALRALLLAP